MVYQCQNSKTVVATYDFEGEKATGLTLTVNDVAVKELMRDEKIKTLLHSPQKRTYGT
ncbi:Uncharacterised protein [Actinobacillus equuli]|nr:Uncharacterised protein [Actinobacillus equuli]